MINSAEEFIRLRTSDVGLEQEKATHDNADDTVWVDIIQRFPEFSVWVIHNKTIPIHILEMLAQNNDEAVREAVARKRKINDLIFSILSIDKSESVRHALICNRKLPNEKKKLIPVGDSNWLQRALEEQLARSS